MITKIFNEHNVLINMSYNIKCTVPQMIQHGHMSILTPIFFQKKTSKRNDKSRIDTIRINSTKY